ncbi:PLP-dependent aminotransferase family protein [Ciceribacter sp. L1K23]|uniref:aminotransferase-like domain-containing protein n=1 Tax=Ciceribacter sp. L1K23 TaxID=2820276 RepID=UPI001B81BE66|nr:PLP-dependent aminotransferase family protein [Ciceribacter sp. L1K23]MBR0555315.1 PLP-dependent aminotransferase family protein [Ciceribacter sp. L1K23]
MTNWLPNLAAGKGPLYVRLADQMEDAIMTGHLPAGSKLPPQRNLAFDVKVTIGTITRAYSLLHERGLVSGEVGRGTYVLPRPNGEAANDPVSASLAGTRPFVAPDDKIRFDSTAAPDVGQAEVLSGLMAEITRDHATDIASYTRSFPRQWFEAGAEWLACNGWRPAPETIVPTLGAHAAIMSVLTVLTSPGDKIVFEHFTYSQVSRAAGLAGRRTALVESDAEGVKPDDFERVCIQQHPKMAFVMSTTQNPTLATMPVERRKAIADIARRHNVWLIEDNLYGALTDSALPLIATFAPERTFVVDGLSKSVAAGVRGGWVACPPHFAQRVRIAHKMMTGGLPFLLAELGARFVLSGEAARIRDLCRREIAARVEIARRELAGFDFRSDTFVPFLWLKLPEPWLSATFKQAAYNDGVLIDDENEFKAGRSEKVSHRVRLGFSSSQDRTEVSRGMKIVRRLLENGAAGYDSVA